MSYKPVSTAPSNMPSDPVNVDNDIRSRIRNLLALPDEKKPPLTPCPTPANMRTAANSDDDNDVGITFGQASGLDLANTGISSFGAARPGVFTSSYDGPAGQDAEPVPDGARRRSNLRGTAANLGTEGDGQTVSMAQRGSAPGTPSRSRRSLRESPGKPDIDAPRRVRSSISKTPVQPRRSLYNFKVTSSADFQPAVKQSKSPAEEPKFRINHVPGSFQSEYDASIKGSRSSSLASLNSPTTVVVEPLQEHSFENVSRDEVKSPSPPPSNLNTGRPSITSPSIKRDSDEDKAAPVVPLLRPVRSNNTTREAPMDPAPPPISLRNVMDTFEGQPPERELIQAVEASSGEAMIPDLGAKSAIAAVDLQVPATLPTVVEVSKESTKLPVNDQVIPALSDVNLRSSEETDTHGATEPGNAEIRDSTRSQVSWEALPHPMSGDEVSPHESAKVAQPQQSHDVEGLQEPNSGAPSPNPYPESSDTWIKQLLGRKSAPAMGQAPPNLTARPHYRSRKVTDDINLLRSNTLPAQTSSIPDGGEPPKGPASFARVITDLEGLLQQALQIAGQANDKTVESRLPGESYATSKGPQSQPRHTKEREMSHESFDSSDEDTYSDSTGLDEEQNHTTTPKRHSNQPHRQSTFAGPDGANRYHDQFKNHRNATPYPVKSLEVSNEPFRQNTATARTESLAVPTQQFSKSNARSHQPMQITIQGDPTDVQNVLLHPIGATSSSVDEADWALKRRPTTAVNQISMAAEEQNVPRKSSISQVLAEELQGSTLRERRPSKTPAAPETMNVNVYSEPRSFSSGDDKEPIAYFTDRPASEMPKRRLSARKNAEELQNLTPTPWEDTLSPLPSDIGGRGPSSDPKSLDLKHRHHFSIREPKMFSLSHSHRRSPIARDWSTSKKRWVALVACINTALVGLIIGIYAGEVPAIQYNIVDEHHYTILGNVVFFVGLAITTSIFWPLPLLYGRKPFTLAALAILVPLQFPQAVAVSAFRTPYTPTYRVALLLSRAIAGLVMGFANINFIATLLDLFGASLQSINPHQEVVNANDVRRHGGGMGVWLGVWTWCFIGSLGLGFFIGAVIISGLAIDWGFWITIILTAFVLVLNVLVPEVRRSPYRRSVAEVRTPTELSRRVARGEVKMHLYSTGPKWWVEEVMAGSALCVRMLKQPGFLVLSTYIGWIYGQIVMVIVLLGALTSRYYRFRPQYVGLCVLSIPVGALFAVPFQRASILSRSRQKPPRTDSMTVNKRLTWTSHFVRRAIFMVSLPFAGLAYTLASVGPQVSVAAPTFFAGLIGFLSNLAIAECNGIIMETWDTSDLQPGMTGRPRRNLPEEVRKKRTHFSSFPRVTAAFAITQTSAFLIAAAGTGAGGAIERRLGAQAATAVVAGILLILTLLLIAVVTRFKEVQIIPTQRYGTNILSGPEDEWKPVIIGNPSGTTRRMSILELGDMTRWKEIRRRNRLTGLEAY
ncbi:MAG: hypothetical protein Q9219_002947 [cf. Caloplaca sp. 3 TL-2023]